MIGETKLITNLNSTAFAGAEVLSRAQLKNVMGGVKDVCAGQIGADLENCQYNVCMAGWDFNTHTDQQNFDKAQSCSGAVS